MSALVSTPIIILQINMQNPIRDSEISYLEFVMKKLENWTPGKAERIEKRRPALEKKLLGLRHKKRGEGKPNRISDVGKPN